MGESERRRPLGTRVEKFHWKLPKIRQRHGVDTISLVNDSNNCFKWDLALKTTGMRYVYDGPLLYDDDSACCVVCRSVVNISPQTVAVSRAYTMLDPLKTKRRLLYLKTQFVPRSKHFSSRL